MNLSKKGRRIFLIMLVVIGVTSRCDCSKESMEVPSELDLVGTWILKSAEFRDDDVDLDGDGPMAPIKDIKFFLLSSFNVYASCSSIDEIPILFSDELTSEATSADPTNKYGVYAVCPEGQGITSQIGEYYVDPFRAHSFYLEILELNDPGNLIDWESQMFITISEDFIQDGVRMMHGNAAIIPSGSHRYRHFDIILEEHTGV